MRTAARGGAGSRLATRLTLLTLVVAGVGMLAMALYVARAVETRALADLKAHLAVQARLLQDAFAPLLDGVPVTREIQARARHYAAKLGARVTVIARDGTVLGESDRGPADGRELENHATRPEVRAAFAGQVGNDVRRSVTVGRDLLYVAVPLETAGDVRGVLRLALPTPEVARATAWGRQIVGAGAALAFALALLVGLVVSRRVARPIREMRTAAQRMASGDFDGTVPVSGRDEIAELGDALNRMAVALREQIATFGAEQAKVHAILNGMVEGVIALDPRGRLLVINPAARGMFGLGAAPVEGRAFLEVIRQRDLLAFVEAVQISGAPGRRELELGPPVGRTLAARAVTLNLAGQGTGVLLVLHDVTALRRLERVRSEFVANVSHELRTPLTCIKGYLETLLDGALTEPEHARRFLEVASAHAERLGRLLDDLLQLADLEGGKVGLVPIGLDLHGVAAGVVATFERQAAQTGVSLVSEVPDGLGVRADRDRLVQILVNLVDNAVKFTPAGGRVTLGAARSPAGVVEVRVADTGIGIPSTDLPRITERFYRVDRARSRELGGTGLGLSIVKHLVQAHGGELAIDSALGHGTTVRFTLPPP